MRFKPQERKFNPQELVESLGWDVRLKSGKAGKFSIKKHTIPADTPIDVVSMRNALMMGYEPLKVRMPEPMDVQKLCRKEQILMSDCFQERFLMRNAILKARGRVLVGGLGLGYVASKIAEKRNVSQVVVVEIEKDVIDLVWQHVKTPKMRLIHADIYKWFKIARKKFDFIYLDIWYGTGECEWGETVVPLRRLAHRLRKPRGKVMCWSEETMRTQIEQSLYTVSQLPEDDPWVCSIPAFVAFRKGLNGDLDKAIDSFVKDVGSPTWERRWGKHWTEEVDGG